MREENNTFDICQLDAAFHLRALGWRLTLRSPLGVPDWGWPQIRLIVAYLLGLRQDFDTKFCNQALEAEVCRVFGARFCLATGSGREAIKLALLGMGAQPGERVVLPSFCCFSVLRPVLELGLEPVLADVGSDLQIDPDSVRRVMRQGDRALIVPHLFGGLADLPQLVAIAHAHGSRVIDDAAQAIGRRGSWGWAGRGGDAGIFSFGLFKPLNAMGGGALLTDDEQLHHRALRGLQESQSAELPRKTVVKSYLKVVWRRATYRLFLYHRDMQQRGDMPPTSTLARNEHLSRIAPLPARLAASQVAAMADRWQQAAQAAQGLRESLTAYPSLMLPVQGSFQGFPRLVIQTVKENYRDLFAALLHAGIEVQPTYRPLHRILRDMGKVPTGEYRHSERLAEQLICLPFSQSVNIAPVLRAVQAISHKGNHLSDLRKHVSWP